VHVLVINSSPTNTLNTIHVQVLKAHTCISTKMPYYGSNRRKEYKPNTLN
jgi:hypothetical protein